MADRLVSVNENYELPLSVRTEFLDYVIDEAPIVTEGELVINVEDHGAVASPAFDNAPAINAIITSVCNNPALFGATLLFPGAEYGFAAPIDLPYFSDKMRAIRMYGRGRSGTKFTAIGSTSSPFAAMIRHQQPRDSVTTIKSPSSGASHEIAHLRIDAAGKAKFGILLTNAHAVHVHDVFIRQPATEVAAGEKTACIKIAPEGTDYLSWENHIGPNVRLEGGIGEDQTQWASYSLWVNSTDNHIDGVVAIRSKDANVCDQGGNNFYTNVHTFYGPTGFYGKQGLGSTFINCEADGPDVQGWLIEGSRTVINACRVFWPGTVPAGAKGIAVAWSMSNTVITGNALYGPDPANVITGISLLDSTCVVTDNTNAQVDTNGWSAAFGRALVSREQNPTVGSGAVDLQFTRTGSTMTASGTQSFAQGASSTASGLSAVAMGQITTADANSAWATGQRSHTRGTIAKRAHSATRFATNGDQQIADSVISRETTATTTVRVNAGGAVGTPANGLQILVSTVPWMGVYEVTLGGFCPSTGDAVAWKTTVIVTKAALASTTAIIGTPSWTTIAGTTTGLTATPGIGVDTTQSGFFVTVTPPNASTWHWVGRIDSVDIG